MSDTQAPSKEKLSDWLRRWYALKGELRFREAADEIERLEAELEQANDIRSDREILIELMRGALGVSIEPHQTLSERLVEAAGKSNVDWCCPHYKPRGKGCTECPAPEPCADLLTYVSARLGTIELMAQGNNPTASVARIAELAREGIEHISAARASLPPGAAQCFYCRDAIGPGKCDRPDRCPFGLSLTKGGEQS